MSITTENIGPLGNAAISGASGGALVGSVGGLTGVVIGAAIGAVVNVAASAHNINTNETKSSSSQKQD